MKKNRLYSLVILLWTAISMVFISCEDDHKDDFELTGNVSKYFPSYCVNLSGSFNWGGGKYFHMIIEPRFYFDASEWGLSIDKVEYYIDNVYYKTETESPYQIEYESRDWYVGAHSVRADITISGSKIETFVLQCSKSLDNSSSQERAADIWFDYNYATTGDEFFITGNINTNRSAPGTSIKSFSCKWDDASMGEKTSTPYKLTHMVTESPETKHNVSASLTYIQGNTTINYGFSMQNYEIPGPNSVKQIFIVKSSYSDYENGEYFQGVARQFIGKNVKSTYGVEIYLDDKLIGASMTFPYELSYKLENFSVGEHTLKKQWVRYDEEGNKTSAYSTDDVITITK